MNKTIRTSVIVFISVIIGLFVGIFIVGMMNSGSSSSSYYSNYPVVGNSLPTIETTYKGSSSVGNINMPKSNDYMIIKTYHVTINDKNVNKVVNDIIAQAEMLNGRIESSSYNQGKYYDKGTITVRIPRENEEKFVNYIKQYKIVASSITAYDISNQYSSLESQIELIQTKIKLYQDYVNSHNLSPEYAEKYYDKIFSLKSQLYYLQKQQEKMGNQTTYTTFYITIYNDKTYNVAGIKINFDKVWYNIKLAWAYIVVFFIYVITILIPIVAILYSIYYIIRKVKKVKIQ